jgi:chromosomal replication initiation ATPase DnaA
MQPTLDDLVPTTGSRRALTAVRALLGNRRAGPRLVLLHGPPGVGKTHLLQAAVRRAGGTAQAATVADMVQAIRGETPHHCGAGLLTVDDLHVLARMPMSQREVGRHLEERVRAGQRVLAAAGDLRELPCLLERLGRIEGARFVEMRPPGTREMTRLVVVLAARSGLRVTTEAAGAMAARCRGDVRLAQGAVARLRLAESMPG